MVIIYNPAAGRRRATLLWRVLDVLVASGLRIEVRQTGAPGDAARIAREAAMAGVPLVVAAGGDGTIAEVAGGLAGTPCALGIIPLGTANVLAHELGLGFAPQAVAANLAFRRTRALWPGIAEGPDGRRLFVQMLGAGFDAEVVHRLSPAMKHRLGRGAYVAQSLRETVRYPFGRIQLRLDGVEHETGSVIVSKGRFYGGAFTLAPEARTDRSGFSVALFAHAGPGAALLYGAALPLNLMPKMPGLRLLRAEKIEILTALVPTQTDGDAAGSGPLAITDAPAPLRVVA